MFERIRGEVEPIDTEREARKLTPQPGHLGIVHENLLQTADRVAPPASAGDLDGRAIALEVSTHL